MAVQGTIVGGLRHFVGGATDEKPALETADGQSTAPHETPTSSYYFYQSFHPHCELARGVGAQASAGRILPTAARGGRMLIVGMARSRAVVAMIGARSPVLAFPACSCCFLFLSIRKRRG